MNKIALIPIDNRPVCYCLPKQIADITNEFELFLPPRELLGDLVKSADTKALMDWLENQKDCDFIILSLDTIAYGGLVNSRRSNDPFEVVCQQLNQLKDILSKSRAKIFAFSSIMRISNNNYNEEEKEYWSRWGKKIFDWSYNFHSSQKNNDNECLRKHNCISTIIPNEILDDYLATRKRNFEINKIYLNWVYENILDFLVFSKDDCAKYGLNVMEAEELDQIIKNKNLNEKAIVKTGADEIPLTLLSRVFTSEKKLRIFPRYTQPEFTNKISKYEDISVGESVNSQIELAGAKVAKSLDDADFELLVNNFKNEQGELLMDVFESGFAENFELDNIPTAIADILNANGADNEFVKTLFEKDWSNIIGYAGWNTTGNTLGSVIAIACATFFGKKNLNKALFTRFIDDWAYQANVRSKLKEENSFDTNAKMHPFVDKINQKLGTNYIPSYLYPWNRHFEIEVVL